LSPRQVFCNTNSAATSASAFHTPQFRRLFVLTLQLPAPRLRARRTVGDANLVPLRQLIEHHARGTNR
jgi:hypothetical protein